MTLLKPHEEATSWEQIPKDVNIVVRARSYKRRFALLAITTISILVIILFSSYLRSSDSSLGGAPPSSKSPSSSNTPTYVFPISTNVAIPYSKWPGLSTLKYSGAVGVSPEWAPVPNSSGQITNGGDIGIIDATSATKPLMANVTITNLKPLSKSYSSFAFPIDIYEWCPSNTSTNGVGTPCGTKAQTGPHSTANTAGSWVPFETGSPYAVRPSQQLFITNSTGSVSFTLPKGYYYDITMDAHQGSFYCISTSNPSALSPSFYISAKES